MRYPLGQPVRLSTTVKDLTGTLVNATTLTLTVQKPDASTQAYAAPTNDSTGAYHQDVPAADLAMNGHYQYKWVATGTGAGVSFSAFDVFDPFEIAVLSRQDAKDQLNIDAAVSRFDAEIDIWVATVESTLEKLTGGPLVNTTVTEFVEVSRSYRSLAVRRRPLVSVTSITDNATGTAIPTTDLDVDTNAGIIRRKLDLPFWSRGPYYTVVYVAGWGTAVPAAFNAAARIILDHLWETQRGPSARPTMSGDDPTTDTYGLGFAIPNRAAELMGPYTVETALG